MFFHDVILPSSTTSNSQQSQCLHPGSPLPPPFSPPSLLCTVSAEHGNNPGSVRAHFDFSSTLCSSNMLNGTALVLRGPPPAPVSADCVPARPVSPRPGRRSRRVWLKEALAVPRCVRSVVLHGDICTRRETPSCTCEQLRRRCSTEAVCWWRS